MKKIHFTQAGSSEMFGSPLNLPLNEKSPMNPISPYAKSKFSAFKYCQKARIEYGLRISNLILFNHESHLRKFGFLTHRIVSQALKLQRGKIEFVSLKYGEIQRDWGHSVDFMNAISLCLENNTDDDLIISTNKHHSVNHFAATALKVIGVENYASKIRSEFNSIPMNIPKIIYGDNSKIGQLLHWAPKYDFEKMILDIVSNFQLSE